MRNMMPLNLILIVEIFDVWGIDFMRDFIDFIERSSTFWKRQ